MRCVRVSPVRMSSTYLVGGRGLVEGKQRMSSTYCSKAAMAARALTAGSANARSSPERGGGGVGGGGVVVVIVGVVVVVFVLVEGKQRLVVVVVLGGEVYLPLFLSMSTLLSCMRRTRTGMPPLRTTIPIAFSPLGQRAGLVSLRANRQERERGQYLWQRAEQASLADVCTLGSELSASLSMVAMPFT